MARSIQSSKYKRHIPPAPLSIIQEDDVQTWSKENPIQSSPFHTFAPPRLASPCPVLRAPCTLYH
ncbi:uncharacterized protein BKA78DRAFT_319069 [Phyllosticta capitalensis]|uniref:uncharacterized protein n=1 Tax=Phyllosticta capitalensis TaxID=121624 RepID=UPI00312D0980